MSKQIIIEHGVIKYLHSYTFRPYAYTFRFVEVRSHFLQLTKKAYWRHGGRALRIVEL